MRDDLLVFTVVGVVFKNDVSFTPFLADRRRRRALFVKSGHFHRIYPASSAI